MLLYVAGALEPAEAVELRAHLAKGCPACAGALAEAEATVHQIPIALRSQTPPAGAWERIENRIALQEERGNANGGAESLQLMPAKRSPMGWVGWAVAAGVLIVMGLVNQHLSMQLADAVQGQGKAEQGMLAARDALATARMRSDEMERDLAGAKEALASAQDENKQVQVRLTGLEARVKELTSDHEKMLVRLDRSKDEMMMHVSNLMDADRYPVVAMAAPGVTGKLMWNKETGMWTLMAANLKPLPAGRTYELWAIDSKKNKMAAGTFEPTTDGMAMHEVKMPAGEGEMTTAAVTDEPMGGVSQPSGQIQFVADVSR
jgi:anti-sigma-K factor RskA